MSEKEKITMTKYFVIGFAERKDENGWLIDGKPHVVSQEELDKEIQTCEESTGGTWTVVILTKFEINQL